MLIILISALISISICYGFSYYYADQYRKIAEENFKISLEFLIKENAKLQKENLTNIN